MGNKKVEYNWEIYIKGNDLIIELNGGINSILDMSHECFEDNKQKKKEEIIFFSQFTKTSVKGIDIRYY